MNAPSHPIAKEVLLSQWLKAKEHERQATELRRQIESQLVSLLPKKEEGSESENVGEYKLTVTTKINRKVDTVAVRTTWDVMPDKVKTIFRWTADIDIKALRALPDDAYVVAAQYITATPASPSFKVEPINQGK
jgi:hypothetical protein